MTEFHDPVLLLFASRRWLKGLKQGSMCFERTAFWTSDILYDKKLPDIGNTFPCENYSDLYDEHTVIIH